MSENYNELLNYFDKGYHADTERIDGEIFDMIPHGYFHELIGRNLFRILDNYVSQNASGEVFYYGMMYVLESFPDKTWLVPDVSYIKHASIKHPISWRYEYAHLGVPDLAVEVVSVQDEGQFIQKKVWTWLDKGTHEVWLLYPHQKQFHQYTNNDRKLVRVYGSDLSDKAEGSIIDAKALFPNIQGLTTDAIFNLPIWATQKDDE